MSDGLRKDFFAPGVYAGPVALARRLWSERIVRFILVGVMNTAFGYLVFYAALQATGAPLLSIVASTIAGIAFNFGSIGRLVFRSSDPRLLFKFVAAYGLVVLADAAGLRGLEWIGLGVASGQAVLTPPLAILSYLLNARFVFSRTGKTGHA